METRIPGCVQSMEHLLKVGWRSLILYKGDIRGLREPKSGIARCAERCRRLKAYEIETGIAVGHVGGSLRRDANIVYDDAFKIAKWVSPQVSYGACPLFPRPGFAQDKRDFWEERLPMPKMHSKCVP